MRSGDASQFADYLESLARDFSESGYSATGDDFERAARTIRGLVTERNDARTAVQMGIDECDRLRTRIASARRDVDHWRNEAVKVAAERDDIKAGTAELDIVRSERDALRRHVERIREQTEYALAGWGAKKS